MTSNTSLSQSCRFRWSSPLFAWLTFVIALLPLAAQAQSAGTGTITGRVMNAGTGDYLRNAVVTVVGTDISTIAEAGGNFRLLNVPAGEVKIRAEFAGLDPLEIPIKVAAGETVSKDINLTSAVYDKDTILLDQFVVAGEREGNAKALQEQKNAVNMKQVIAADAFGDVSEGNVGEFMKRMSGVAIDYTEADARQIRIRGMNPKYAVVLMDGAPVASAGSSAIGTGRAFELEQLSIASIETVELTKTPTPDQNASAVAGVINLRSKSAFDSKGRRITFQASAALNSYDWLRDTNGPDDGSTRKIMPNFSLNYADVIWHGKLGLQAGVNYSKTFAEQKAETVSYRWDTDATNNKAEVPMVLGFGFRDSPKVSTRVNYNTRLDFKLSPTAWFYTRLDYNTYEAKFYSRDFSVNMSQTTAGRGTINATATNSATILTPTDPNVEYSWNSQTSQGLSTGYANTQFNQGGGATNKHGATVTWTTYGEVEIGALKSDLQLQYSRATNWYSDLSDGFFWAVATNSKAGQFRFNRNGPEDMAVQFTQLQGTDWRDLNNYYVAPSNNSNPILNTSNSLISSDRRSVDKKYSAQLNFQYPLLWAIPTDIRWGAAVNESSREIYYNKNNTNYTYVGPDRVASTADDNAKQFKEAYQMDFDTGTNVEGLSNLDRWALARLYQVHPEYFVSPNADQLALVRMQNHYNLAEQINAAYLQTKFKFLSGKLTIAPGVRFEQTRSKGSGPKDIGGRLTMINLAWFDPAGPNPFVAITPNATSPNYRGYIDERYGKTGKASSKYSDVFKYLHLNYQVTKDLLLRASYHESITRPDLNNLFEGYTVTNDTTQAVNVNNPELKPERARSLNADVEYYFGKGGNSSVTAGVFRSDMRDLQKRTTYNDSPDGAIPGTSLIYPELKGYDINVWTNVDKAHNYGFEVGYNQSFDFLPGALSGFSTFANYTHIIYDSWANFLSSPKDTANAGISYSYGKFDARVSYNWTGFFMTGTAAKAGSADAGIANYVRARGLTDVNFSYKITRRLRIFANGRNIFNEGRMEYRMDSRVITRQARFGALWTVGISGMY